MQPYLKYDILVPITEGRSEWVGSVSGGGAVEHHRPLADAQRTRHRLPLAVRSNGDRAAALHQRVRLASIKP